MSVLNQLTSYQRWKCTGAMFMEESANSTDRADIRMTAKTHQEPPGGKQDGSWRKMLFLAFTADTLLELCRIKRHT